MFQFQEIYRELFLQQPILLAHSFKIIPQFIWIFNLKVNELEYLVLFVVSKSIKKLSSVDCVDKYFNWLCQYLSFLTILFNRFCPMEKRRVTSWFIKFIMYFLHLLLFVSYKKLAINMFKCSMLTCIDYRKVSFILHCVICVCIQSYSGLHFPAFGLNMERYTQSFNSEILKML